MRYIIFILFIISYSFSTSKGLALELEKKSLYDNPYKFTPPPPIVYLYQSIAFKRYTGFEHLVYKNYEVITNSLNSSSDEEYLIHSEYYYQISILYKYLYASLDLGYMRVSNDFYATSRISSVSESSEGFLFRPEIGAKVMFLYFILGIPVYTGDILSKYAFIESYNINYPYFKFHSEYPWGHLPAWSTFSYSLSFAKNIDDYIHGFSTGIRWEIVYYVTLFFSYEPSFKIVSQVTPDRRTYLENTLSLQFTFRLMRELSIVTSFKNSTYSSGNPVNNQIYIGINYLMQFDPSL